MTRRFVERARPYRPMSARFTVNETLRICAAGWVIGAIAYIAVSVTGQVYRWYAPYWHGDGAFFAFGLTMAAGSIAAMFEVKIRQRQK